MEVKSVAELGIGDHVMNRLTGRRGVVIALDPSGNRVRVRARCSASKDILTKWNVEHCRVLAYR